MACLRVLAGSGLDRNAWPAYVPRGALCSPLQGGTMFRLVLAALVLIVAAFVGRTTALAAGTLDQTYTASPNLFADIDSSISFEEKYTAGISGTLDHVSLNMTNVDLTGATPNLVVQILNAKGAVIG